MKKITFPLSALAIAAIFFLVQITDVLLVSEVYSQNVVHAEKVSPGTVFTVEWIHSVELEPWEEHFEIGGDMKIYLEKTRFKAFGAGVPDSAGTSTEVKDGYIVFSGIHKEMPNLAYGVSPTAEHTLKIGGKVIYLYKTLPPDTAVSFKVERLPLWKYFLLALSDQ